MLNVEVEERVGRREKKWALSLNSTQEPINFVRETSGPCIMVKS